MDGEEFGDSTPPKPHRKKRNEAKSKKKNEKNKKEGKPKDDNKWKISNKPNVFLALQVSDKEKQLQMKLLQDYIISRGCKKLSKTRVSAQKAHLTLKVLNVPDEEHMQCLRNICSEIARDFENGVHFRLKGLGHFGQKVVFVDVEEKEEVILLEQRLKVRLRDIFADIPGNKELSDNKAFKPHVTLLKTSRVVPFDRRLKIEREIFEDVPLKDDLGVQKCEKLQILDLIAQGEKGYYRIIDEICLKNKSSATNEAFRMPKSLVVLGTIALASFVLYKGRQMANRNLA